LRVAAFAARRGGAPTERINRLTDPAYTSALDTRSIDDLRMMKAECAEFEHALSYYRRLAQARIEILGAEQSRRERGGTVEELVAELPRILSSDAGRASAATARVASPDAPAIDLRWPDGRERLVADTTLAQLPALTPEELDSTLAELRDFERELSDVRQRLHGVLDVLEREIAARQVAGTAG
jgi:anti-sigma-K factor RsiG